MFAAGCERVCVRSMEVVSLLLSIKAEAYSGLGLFAGYTVAVCLMEDAAGPDRLMQSVIKDLLRVE